MRLMAAVIEYPMVLQLCQCWMQFCKHLHVSAASGAQAGSKIIAFCSPHCLETLVELSGVNVAQLQHTRSWHQPGALFALIMLLLPQIGQNEEH